ncbi:PTS sugar transporter subunit IIA [Clostridium sp. SYSU_GA19001]|uniref:PTS sugar transporter subunit IIA n=1 Tax=Clostridium caldaquaticum TaxID=2940653 RepID=UPI002076F04E|nr:PTS sugar transporter subunit IIA [Clostridium caldaquaticum]MCM8712028.1 PTS sugar transporter subunit IIA [Clostridium caldaquaticum]
MNENVLMEKNVKLHVDASDWIDAMKKSGQLLVDSGFITKDYIQLAIKSVEEFGPYIVIAPGLALSHARPDVSVLNTGVSLLTLTKPIEFNSENDPVDIVLTLAATDDENHIGLLQTLSSYLSEDGKIDYIRSCTDVKALVDDINNYVIS